MYNRKTGCYIRFLGKFANLILPLYFDQTCNTKILAYQNEYILPLLVAATTPNIALRHFLGNAYLLESDIATCRNMPMQGLIFTSWDPSVGWLGLRGSFMGWAFTDGLDDSTARVYVKSQRLPWCCAGVLAYVLVRSNPQV